MPSTPLPTEDAARMSALTVQAVIDAYLKHCEIVGQHCAEARDERLRTLSRFASVFGARALAECAPFHLSDWIESQPRWRSSSTRKAKANQILAAFNWALKQKRIADNPFAGVGYEESEPRPCMPDAALDAIMHRANKRWERAVRFLRLAGCRLSDLSRATWPDVDLARGIIVLQRHKSRRKTRKPKVVVLVAEAVDILLEIRKEQGPDYQGPVFLNNRNTPWNRRTLGQQLRRMKQRGEADTEATLHGIRHQWSHTALKNGASIKMVSLGLAHASVGVTEKYYGHLDDEIDGVRAAANAANRRQ